MKQESPSAHGPLHRLVGQSSPITWRMILSLCGKAGCEMHYEGNYRGTPAQFVRLPSGRSKSGERRIYVIRDDPWQTRPEYKTEKDLCDAIDSVLPNVKVDRAGAQGVSNAE